ncbi:ABC-2 family transporter protein, partial [Microgenomates group bacterium]|nr:ABC-2 family transporter protein [Microgenomates group bacterium]
MKKYWLIFRLSWQNALTYRLNFVMWRVRSIIGFLASYLFWLAIVKSNQSVAGYNPSLLLTYIFTAAFLRNLVFSNVSYSACVEIAGGDLSNYLIKPIGYFKNWLMRDMADKVLNLSFFSVEIIIFYFILKPQIVFTQHLFLFLAVSLLAALLYFFLSFLISAYAFWHPEHNGWPLRFLFVMLLDFLSGASIPLDIFPPAIVKIFQFLPFSYLIFYPTQIWLNRVGSQQI